MLTEFAEEIWKMKYQNNNETLDNYYKRIGLNDSRYIDMFSNLRAHPGGRIAANVNTGKKNLTLSNCFTIAIKNDSMESIMECAKESALILKAGGGVGYNFSILRPKNGYIHTSGQHSSGVVSFMQIFDSTCKTIIAGNNRRGAQMGVLDIWHPDILDFVNAKQNGGFNTFNLSVGVTDEFMNAVENDLDWNLEFPDTSFERYNELWIYNKLGGNLFEWKKQGYPTKIYKTIKARELWNIITKNAYDFAEPGILFFSEANRMNNLYYCEYLNVSNPCGEEILYPYNSCNLASINLVKYVNNHFTNNAIFDMNLFIQDVKLLVEYLDTILDINYYPLKENYDEVKKKRPIGVGITGLGSMFAMMKMRYGDENSLFLFEDIMYNMMVAAYEKSCELAKEKGSFELFDKEKIKESLFIKKLPIDLQEKIYQYGLRNSRILSIAPTGTLSLVCNNVSSGIEPIFLLEYIRKVTQSDGSLVEKEVADYAWSLYKKMFNTNEKPDYFVTTVDLSVEDHINVMSIAQKYVDASISKTINIPKDYSFEKFRDVYTLAYKNGLKGCTTYRPNDIVGSILSDKKTDDIQQENLFVDKFNRLMYEIDLNDEEPGVRHRILWKNKSKLYIFVSVDEDGYPLEIIPKVPKKAGDGKYQFDKQYFDEITSNFDAICRLTSICLRYGIPIEEIINQLDQASYNLYDIANIIKRVLKKYPLIDFTPLTFEDILEENEEPHQELGFGIKYKNGDNKEKIKDIGKECPVCKNNSLVIKDGCNTCLNCGYSKCS